MRDEEQRRQTFVDWVLKLLEERFPWLRTRRQEPATGEDTAKKLSALDESLIRQRSNAPGEDKENER